MDIKNAVEMEANLFGVVNDTNDKKEGMGRFLREESCYINRFLKSYRGDKGRYEKSYRPFLHISG